MPSSLVYCMLPGTSVRRAARSPASWAGFLPSCRALPAGRGFVSGAAHESGSSTWSWLSTWPPSGGCPGRIGSSHCSTNGLMRTSALWPQNGPQSPTTGLAHRVRTHAVTHSELEMRANAGRRHADHEALQDANFRIGLHHAHETHDLAALHQAVGIERQHQGIIGAPTLAEVAHVASLVALVVRAPAIDDAVAIRIGARQTSHGGFLENGHVFLVGVDRMK